MHRSEMSGGGLTTPVLNEVLIRAETASYNEGMTSLYVSNSRLSLTSIWIAHRPTMSPSCKGCTRFARCTASTTILRAPYGQSHLSPGYMSVSGLLGVVYAVIEDEKRFQRFPQGCTDFVRFCGSSLESPYPKGITHPSTGYTKSSSVNSTPASSRAGPPTRKDRGDRKQIREAQDDIFSDESCLVMVVPDIMAEEPSPGETPRVRCLVSYVFTYKRAPRGRIGTRQESRAKAALDHLRQDATPAEKAVLDLRLPKWRRSQPLNGESGGRTHPWASSACAM